MRTLLTCNVVSIRRLTIVGVLTLAIAGSAWAPSFTGGLRGAVREAGGVNPGVTVELINEGTGVSRDSTTNSTGEYNFAAVTPGLYRSSRRSASPTTKTRTSRSWRAPSIRPIATGTRGA